MAEGIVTAVKLSLAIAAGMAFIAAINVLITFLIASPIEGTDFISEALWLLSVFLPFNAHILLGVLEATTAITAFLISQQVYNMTMLTYKSA